MEPLRDEHGDYTVGDDGEKIYQDENENEIVPLSLQLEEQTNWLVKNARKNYKHLYDDLKSAQWWAIYKYTKDCGPLGSGEKLSQKQSQEIRNLVSRNIKELTSQETFGRGNQKRYQQQPEDSAHDPIRNQQAAESHRVEAKDSFERVQGLAARTDRTVDEWAKDNQRFAEHEKREETNKKRGRSQWEPEDEAEEWLWQGIASELEFTNLGDGSASSFRSVARKFDLRTKKLSGNVFRVLHGEIGLYVAAW